MARILVAVSILMFSACVHKGSSVVTTDESVAAGSQVTAGGKPVQLYGGNPLLRVGQPIRPFLASIGAEAAVQGRAAVINVVPSIDTPVCEEQTHLLGETDQLPDGIARLTISRDLPMAQSRFAKEAKLTNIQYFSDYKSGAFGKSSGLMMQGSELLARAVIVVDSTGIVRHVQIVPNVATLPNMNKAFEIARQL